MTAELPTCCEFHGIDCSVGQGRACPARQAANHKRVMNQPLGYEAGNYYAPVDKPVVTPNDFYRWAPLVWWALVLIGAVAGFVWAVTRPQPLWVMANYVLGAV